MKANRMLAYIDLISELTDKMVDEHIMSWNAPNKNESKKHLEKREIAEKMLFEVAKKANAEANS